MSLVCSSRPIKTVVDRCLHLLCSYTFYYDVQIKYTTCGTNVINRHNRACVMTCETKNITKLVPIHAYIYHRMMYGGLTIENRNWGQNIWRYTVSTAKFIRRQTDRMPKLLAANKNVQYNTIKTCKAPLFDVRWRQALSETSSQRRHCKLYRSINTPSSKWVLSRLRKVKTDVADEAPNWRLFQMVGAATLIDPEAKKVLILEWRPKDPCSRRSKQLRRYTGEYQFRQARRLLMASNFESGHVIW